MFGYDHGAGRKEYIWILTMYTVFRVIIMWDSKHCTVTRTIHMNLISWVCSVTRARLSEAFSTYFHVM